MYGNSYSTQLPPVYRLYYPVLCSYFPFMCNRDVWRHNHPYCILNIVALLGALALVLWLLVREANLQTWLFIEMFVNTYTKWRNQCTDFPIFPFPTIPTTPIAWNFKGNGHFHVVIKYQNCVGFVSHVCHLLGLSRQLFDIFRFVVFILYESYARSTCSMH